MKILLTDDSKTMRKIQKHALIRMVYEQDNIIEASDGVEALLKLEEHKFDYEFIMMDINMEGMSGIETLKQIRRNTKSAKIPVIMCTSVSDKSQVMQAIIDYSRC